MKRSIRLVVSLALCVAPALCVGCTSVFPARNPTGEALPRVTGETLTGGHLTLPDDLLGRPTVLLVIYQSLAQDEVNYWAMVATANMPDAQLFEVAAFTQFKYFLTKRRIIRQATDRIPEALHDRLVGIWWDGSTLARFTGNPRDGHARLLLLDEHGQVLYFTDQGFNSQTMRDFLDAVRALQERGE
ncbi:hypothetical protein OT109_07240 [Phycisphaeraceae bacterium D3-23]